MSIFQKNFPFINFEKKHKFYNKNNYDLYGHKSEKSHFSGF